MMPEYWAMNRQLGCIRLGLATSQSTPTISDFGAKLHRDVKQS